MIFSKISWFYFICVLLTMLVIYYAALVVIFYKEDIRKFFRKEKNNETAKHEDFDETTDGNEANERDQFAELGELIDTIKLIIAGASVRKYSRSDLVKVLRLQIRDYPQMKAQAFYVAINNTLEMECQAYHIAVFSESELSDIWNF